ncbi:hypothetical protein GGX14DRAFT_455975 [Mycena pura]|uniref:Uncharacterized protein n=1 Tax=Mycena pura TaxID=153505 RepID=A0AAD6VA39_9AGAR|nr:hypothetical protein GGX14DRAFT_455975 [Mycena pura]
MTYTILGRVIPKQYLSMGVLGLLGGVAVYSTRGKPGPRTVDDAKKSVPINAGSREEEVLETAAPKH